MTKNIQGTIAVPVFDGENYELWATRMKTTLRIQKLWEVVEKGLPAEPTKKSDSLEEWKEKEMEDIRALQLLQMAVTDLVLKKVVSSTNSKDIWERLQETYQGNDQAKLVRLDCLNKEFEDLKMQQGETIRHYTDKLQEIVNQMSLLGEEKTSHQVIRKILNSMPKAYAGLAALMQETKDLKKISVTDLVGSLISHEAKYLPDEEPIENAYYARSKGGNFGQKPDQHQRSDKWCNICKKDNHKEEDCYFKKGNSPWCGICKKNNHKEEVCYFRNKEERSNGNKQVQGECFVCGKTGHYAKNCKNKFNQEANLCQDQEELEKRYGELSFTATTYETSQIYEEGAWLIDSGATCHMIRDETFFTRLDKTYQVQIKFGCGEILTSAGKGDISMETKQGKVTIKDVLLIPGLDRNLLSVPQLLDKGYKVLFDVNTCTIMDKAWKKLIEVQRDNQKFVIKWELIEEKENKAKEEKTQPQKTQDAGSESTTRLPTKEECYKEMKTENEEEEKEAALIKREKIEATANESRGSVGIDPFSVIENGLSRKMENEEKGKEEKKKNKEKGNQATKENEHEEKENKKNGKCHNKNW